MSVDSGLRASDTDREHVAAALREHTAEGRLNLDEMLERIDAVFSARTLGDLERLVADLPATSAGVRPSRTARPAWDSRCWGRGRAPWTTYGVVAVLSVAIWLATSLAAGGLAYFWPVWVIGPWGLSLLVKVPRRAAVHRLSAWKGG